MDDTGDRPRTLEDIEREHLLRTLARTRIPRAEPPMIHSTEIAEVDARSPICREWNFYRFEVGRLLAEGYEGKWVMIEGEEIVGLWETSAHTAAYRRTRLPNTKVFVKQLRTWETLDDLKCHHIHLFNRPSVRRYPYGEKE